MRIQCTENAPNFQANHLRTVKFISGSIRKRENVIDIYSINKKDKDLINKLLLKLDLKNRIDEEAVKEKSTINGTIRYLLTKALMTDENSKYGVYISVKNGKKINGILDYTNSEMALLKNIMVWDGKNRDKSRQILFKEFMTEMAKNNRMKPIEDCTDIFVYSEPASLGNKWLRDRGFIRTDNNNYIRERLKLSDNYIQGYAHREKAASAKKDVEIINLEI